MDSLGPIINVLMVLTVLSVAAERVTNLVKLRREEAWRSLSERDRELRITFTNVGAGILLAGVMKADLLGMLMHPDSPWATLGWTHWNGQAWERSAAAASFGSGAYALIGTAITGVALGFGSKFWHDVLGIVVELKKITESRSVRATRDAGGRDAVRAHKRGEG